MKEKLFIPIILGTNREGRKSERVAWWLRDVMEKREDIETVLIDVRNFTFPRDGYGTSVKDMFPQYRTYVLRADGFVIVSPEYNHGYPGTLKSVLDLLLKEYFHKPVGLVGVSSGVLGGARVIEGLLHVVRELGMAPIFKDINIIKAGELFDETGHMRDEAYYERAKGFLDELAWMARTLRVGRDTIPSSFRQIE